MKLSQFQRTIDFPTRGDGVYMVYVLFYFVEDVEKAKPFYVGQTGRFDGRMADYDAAAFAAATDFKVGEAIQYLKRKGAKIKVGYDDCAALAKESALIKHCEAKDINLLNAMPGFDYRLTNAERERERVHRYCDDKIWKG